MSGIQHTTGKLMHVGWVLWKFLPRIKSPAVGPSSPMWWESETPRGSNRKLSWSGCWPHTACLGTCLLQFSSVQFSHSVVSYSLWPHELQHARPRCPSPTPGIHSHSHPSSQWCHPAVSSSVVPFCSCPQFLPASESFPMSQLITWGGQSTGVSALTSFLPENSHPGLISFRMDWLDLLAVQGTLKSLLQHHSSKASVLWCSAFFTVQLSHPYMTTGKTIALTRWTFVGNVISLLFNMLSRLVITFLPRGKPIQY